MLDKNGLVCEYDGYVIPEKGEDTPENRILREEAMARTLEKARRIIKERGADIVRAN